MLQTLYEWIAFRNLFLLIFLRRHFRRMFQHYPHAAVIPVQIQNNAVRYKIFVVLEKRTAMIGTSNCCYLLSLHLAFYFANAFLIFSASRTPHSISAFFFSSGSLNLIFLVRRQYERKLNSFGFVFSSERGRSTTPY